MRLDRTLLVSPLLAVVAMQPVFAADETPAESGDTLQEVIVTAQKREETAQKTPVSMNVYDSSKVAQEAIVDLQSLSQTDPNLVFNRNGGEATLALRGITTNDTTEIGNPSVPVGVDSFFVNRAAALDSMLFDIARIEVLLGPQGTLFGRSSIGGLVNIITNKPTRDLEAGGALEYGNYNAVNSTGYANLPASDWLQFRIAFSDRHHEGYRTNTYSLLGAQPGAADDEDSQAGRITAMFEPTENFTGWLSYQQEKEGGAGAAILQVPWVTLPNGDISRSLPNLGDPNAFPMYGLPWQRISDKVTKWNLAYSLPADMTITYLGGYDTFDWRHSTSSLSFFQTPATTNIFLPIRPFIQTEAPRTQNHELRLASAPTGFFTWQAGLYYFKEKNDLNSAGIENPGTALATPLLSFVYNVNTSSKAGYAQGSLHFTDTTALSLGARYSKDDISRAGVFALPVFGIPPGPSGVGSASDSKATWHVGYDWNWTPTNLLYGKVDTGYKPGGIGSCNNFGPETVTTEEVGSKNRWAGDTLQWNAAAFYSDYKNQQITQFTPTCATGSVTTNAGSSKIYGLETDFKALVQQVGTFDVGLSLLHATYSALALPPNNGTAGLKSCRQVDALGNCVLDGNTMIQSPKVSASVGYDRVFPLLAGDFDFRIEARYTGKVYFDPFNYADTTQPGYTLLNSYLTYKRDNWSVGLYGRNLTNKTYLNYAQEVATGGATQYSYSYGAPRVFGVHVEAHVK